MIEHATLCGQKQIKNLRRHISQATVEKEQLLQSLHEIEEACSGPVSIRTAVKEEDSNGGEKEVMKFSAENSELPFAITDAATYTEQF
jgi:hypothetical protein